MEKSNHSKRHSLINAVNIQTNGSDGVMGSSKWNIDEVISIFLPIFGYFVRSRLFDIFYSIILVCFSLIFSLVALIQSGKHLILSLSDFQAEKVREVLSEIESNVYGSKIKVIRTWQINDDYSVAVVKLTCDPKAEISRQELLRYVISLFQRIGFLDVTVEIDES